MAKRTRKTFVPPPMPLVVWGIPDDGCVDVPAYLEITKSWPPEAVGVFAIMLEVWAENGRWLPADIRTIARLTRRDDALEGLFATQKYVFDLFEKRDGLLRPKSPPFILEDV